jgi:dephospho-CoA kinase
VSANKTVIIGLTGGIGSGKTEAARHLENLGAVHVDADAISRSLTAPGGEALGPIREVFGDMVFLADGTLDRRALGEVVFADTAARRALEGIIHPRVQRVIMEAVDKARGEDADAVLLDVPLLFETGMDALCDVNLLITADREKRIERVMARDGLTREAVEARMNSQMSDDDKASMATKVISNDQSMEKFRNELTNIYNQLIRNR